MTRNDTEVATGDGTEFTFTPDDDGTYHVTVTVDDGDTGPGTDQATITVSNAAPQVKNTTSSPSVTGSDKGTGTNQGTITVTTAPDTESEPAAIDNTSVRVDPEPYEVSNATVGAVPAAETGLTDNAPASEAAHYEASLAAPAAASDGAETQLLIALTIIGLLLAVLAIWLWRRALGHH